MPSTRPGRCPRRLTRHLDPRDRAAAAGSLLIRLPHNRGRRRRLLLRPRRRLVAAPRPAPLTVGERRGLPRPRLPPRLLLGTLPAVLAAAAAANTAAAARRPVPGAPGRLCSWVAAALADTAASAAVRASSVSSPSSANRRRRRTRCCCFRPRRRRRRAAVTVRMPRQGPAPWARRPAGAVPAPRHAGDVRASSPARHRPSLVRIRGVLGGGRGITSNTLVRSSQSSSGPAGGASGGYGLGRGAAGPDHRCTTTAARALRVIV